MTSKWPSIVSAMGLYVSAPFDILTMKTPLPVRNGEYRWSIVAICGEERNRSSSEEDHIQLSRRCVGGNIRQDEEVLCARPLSWLLLRALSSATSEMSTADVPLDTRSRRARRSTARTTSEIHNAPVVRISFYVLVTQSPGVASRKSHRP